MSRLAVLVASCLFVVATGCSLDHVASTSSPSPSPTASVSARPHVVHTPHLEWVVIFKNHGTGYPWTKKAPTFRLRGKPSRVEYWVSKPVSLYLNLAGTDTTMTHDWIAASGHGLARLKQPPGRYYFAIDGDPRGGEPVWRLVVAERRLV